MPIPRVTTEFNSTASTPTTEQYNDVLVLGRATGANEPSAGFNDPSWYSDPANVATDYGDSSDVHVASQMLDSRGVGRWKVVVFEEAETTEVLGNSDVEATQSASATSAPWSGEYDVTVSVDGTANTVTAVTETPPSAAGEPDPDEAFVNYDDGAVYTGTATSGAGTGIEVTYRSVDWTTGFNTVDPYDTDILTLADVRAGRAHIGDVEQAAQWGSGHYVRMPLALENGASYPSQQDALAAGQDVLSYTQAGNVMGIFHMSTDDVAASEAGKWATKPVWDDPSSDGRGYPGVSMTQYYDASLIGDPETPGTIEGGRDTGGGAGEGVGRGNAIHPATYGSQLTLTNSQTTLGANSNYRYIDIYATEGLADHEVKRGLSGLLDGDHDVNFTETGRLQIQNKVDTVLAQYEGDDRAWSDLQISVPHVTELSEDLRGNRIWSPIGVQYRYNGSVHRFHVQFGTTV